MIFFIVFLSLLLLIVCIAYFKINAFLSFLFVSIISALALGVSVESIPAVIEKGIGGVMGSLTLVIVLGAMLGKLIAESGAAENIAKVMVHLFGIKHLQWGMAFTGFIVGIPLFYGVGFVLLIPLIFSIVYKYKVSAVYIGLPMLAALSVTHGFIPPHPSPVALVSLFGANMGLTLIYGLIVAIPAIIIGGPIFGKSLNSFKSGESQVLKDPVVDNAFRKPTVINSFTTALLPVILLIIFTIVSVIISKEEVKTHAWIAFLGAPSLVMLGSLIYSSYSLGLKQGRTLSEIMHIYGEAVKDIAMILLIIAGSGVFKQVMEVSGVSLKLAASLQQLPIHPFVLAWLITAIIRGCVGSATVAALTAASVLIPLMESSGANANLMVLAIGAGSLMFSHVNDAGFWMFKEYFGLSVKDTLKTWSVMEAIVSVVGLIGVMVLSMFL